MKVILKMAKKMKFFSLLVFLGAGTGLVGCTSYSNKFDCPYGSGVGCASLSKVDKMMDAQLIETQEELPNLTPQSGKKSVKVYFGPNRPVKPLALEALPVI